MSLVAGAETGSRLSTARVAVAATFMLAVALLWAGGAYSPFPGGYPDAATTVQVAAERQGDVIAFGAINLAYSVLFCLAMLGVAGSVRGRGEWLTTAAAVLVTAGVASHAGEAVQSFTLVATARSGGDAAVAVWSDFIELSSPVFLLIPVFLLGLLLLPYGLWRAGRLPLAVPVATTVVVIGGMIVGAGADKSSPRFWLPVAVHLVLTAWQAVAIARADSLEISGASPGRRE
ncbi:hypothetical protein ACFP3Q_09615 [Nocardioides sp. GCM10027113]|uniref:hypothetical protein n=1 Tax=unclassified Nocardioides TaxID=2615069 RepID=UPI00360CC28E